MLKDDIGYTFNELDWDTKYFGITSAKAVLHKPLNENEWEELKQMFKEYQFVSIVNQNSEPVNAQRIGKDTTAFLADVNIQFTKTIQSSVELPENIKIHQALEFDNQIIQIANFQFSKFTEDPELAKRGGDQVYNQWLINSFGKENKYYGLSIYNNQINGFVLFSFQKDASLIEFIASSNTETSKGIGTKLFRAVEYVTIQKGLNKIIVGTQIRNLGAINFYHKVGCKQVGCHQVYHLWKENIS